MGPSRTHVSKSFKEIMLRWSLSVGILRSSGIFFKPQKSIILKGFSADSNKPIKTHCPSSFQQIRTTSEARRQGGREHGGDALDEAEAEVVLSSLESHSAVKFFKPQEK